MKWCYTRLGGKYVLVNTVHMSISYMFDEREESVNAWRIYTENHNEPTAFARDSKPSICPHF